MVQKNLFFLFNDLQRNIITRKIGNLSVSDPDTHGKKCRSLKADSSDPLPVGFTVQRS